MNLSSSSFYLAQEAELFGGLFFIVWLGIIVLVIAGFWKVFEKAGQPGWAAIIPIYNLIVLIQVAGRPLWWIVLLIVPFVNFVIAIILSLDVARKFGKDALFGVGLALLGFIFYPVLGFGDAKYHANA